RLRAKGGPLQECIIFDTLSKQDLHLERWLKDNPPSSGDGRNSVRPGYRPPPLPSKLADFAREGALYFGDDLFVAAHHGGLQLVNVGEVDFRNGDISAAVGAGSSAIHVDFHSANAKARLFFTLQSRQ